MLEAMDQIDGREYQICLAVWDEEQVEYKNVEALLGDLVIFEEMEIADGVLLPGFDINKILDDMVCHVTGDCGLVVYDESYANFTHFNVEACFRLEGIGYARPGCYKGLAREGGRSEED